MKVFQDYTFRGAGAAATLAYNYYTASTRLSERTARSRTVTLQKRKRKQQDSMMNGALFSRSSRQFGRYKKKTVGSAHRKIALNEEKIIHRWQNVSRFGLGPGEQPMYTYRDAVAPNDFLCQPVHVFDLTRYINNTSGPDTVHGMHAVFNKVSTGEVFYGTSMHHQNAEGVQQPLDGTGFVERGVPPENVPYARLKWTDLKMNLYGSYGRPVKWRIMLVKIHDEGAVPGFSAGTNANHKQMWDDILRPMKYSNLLGNIGEQKKSYRIVRSWNYTIEPLLKTEQWNINENLGNENIAPHFIELKCFLKHDINCKYDWHDAPTAANLTTDAPQTNLLQTELTEVHASVYPTKRLFLVVQCSCADEIGVASGYLAPWEPFENSQLNSLVNKYGSYDICLRRCFSVTK